jgi:hypothetical protein
MVLTIVPVYALTWGWRNFLWFSDVALITTAFALWFESPLLASMMSLAVLVPELLWNVAFFSQLTTGYRVGPLADYMFDRSKPRYLRGLSLFHVPLPAVLLWLVYELGYDERAFLAQTLVAWVVLPLTYLVVRPHDENINWVRGFGARQTRFPPLVFLAFLLLAFPLGLYLPTHYALKTLFAAP